MRVVVASITGVESTLEYRELFALIVDSWYTHAVSDLHLASLKLLFDRHALKATSIVDSNGVSCFIGEQTGRRVYRVKGGKGATLYTVFPGHYCSCHSFFYDIVSKSEGIYVRVLLFFCMCSSVTLFIFCLCQRVIWLYVVLFVV